jgi:outer membrane receptor protein involved in Fe transport
MTNLNRFFARILFFALLFCATPLSAQGSASVQGVVTDGNEDIRLPGANVRLYSSRVSLVAITDTDGAFAFDNVSPGIYGIEVSYIGFRPWLLTEIKVVSGDPTVLNVKMRSSELSLDEIVVTPGRFSILSDAPSAPQTLTRKEFEAMPFVGQDIYRAVSRLPGVTASDFSARFTVRGGDYDEILVTLDGLELYEPFHLKDLGGGVMSVIDVGLIQGVDLMTGGFPAEYGDRETAVLEMRTRTPREGVLTRAEIGIMQATLRAEGATDKLGYMISGRMSHLDRAVAKFNPDDNFSPDFYDIFGKLTYQLNDRHQLSLNGLLAADDVTAIDETLDEFSSRYANGYAWAAWNATLGRGANVRTIAHVGQLFHRRRGTELGFQNAVTKVVDDWRNTHIFGLKSDVQLTGNQRHAARFGVDLKRAQTKYDFFERSLIQGPRRYVTDSALEEPSGTEIGLYVSDKIRATKMLTFDLGARYDRHSWTGDSEVSPRAGAALSLNEQTVLRAAWGHYYQAQGIQEMQVEDGERNFQAASRSTHYMAGIERRIGRGVLVRAEAYYKDLDDIKSRYENLDDETDFIPEAESDRVQLFPLTGVSKGIELFVRRDTGRLNWWMNYAFASVRESFDFTGAPFEVLGDTSPRRFDQRHSFSIDLIFRPKDNWHVGAGWEIREGWPYTPRYVETVTHPSGNENRSLVLGEFLSARYPVYHRLDMKISHWYDYGRVQMRVAFGLTNVYNRENVRRYSYTQGFGGGGPGGGPGGGQVAGPTFGVLSEGWLPALPFVDVGFGF